MLLAAPGQCSACRTYCDDLSQHRCLERARLKEWTPDGAPQVWLLYQPEPYPPGGHEDQAIHLWVRRCSAFTSRAEAITHLDNLLGHQVPWRPYDPLFPELWIGIDHRGYRWLMEPAPVGGAR